jgi:hypothetical protein
MRTEGYFIYTWYFFEADTSLFPGIADPDDVIIWPHRSQPMGGMHLAADVAGNSLLDQRVQLRESDRMARAWLKLELAGEP